MNSGTGVAAMRLGKILRGNHITMGGLIMRFLTILAALLIAMTLAGCAGAPIMNVNDAPVTSAAGKALTREQVRGAIVSAGATLGWKITDESPNVLVGTLMVRTHTAVVAIPYSANNYSIKYRSSANLDEKGGSIHKNYNGWIQNLTRDINAKLSAS